MRVLCSVIVVAGFTIVAIVGVFRVLNDLLAISEGAAPQELPTSGEDARWRAIHGLPQGGARTEVNPGFDANQAASK